MLKSILNRQRQDHVHQSNDECSLQLPRPSADIVRPISYIFWTAPILALCHLSSSAADRAMLPIEDLDSIVTDAVRSHFLNVVDGLEPNDSILMIGSTNHFERLDVGISKRPSRFDRKYIFPEPDLDQRVQYCEYWAKRLSGTDDVEFLKGCGDHA